MERMNDYRTLGRTGLKVSPLGLGVMTELDHFFEPALQDMIHGGVNVRHGS